MDEAQETAGGASRSRPGEAATSLVDRYGALLKRLDAEAVAKKLRGIEHRLWFGEPGSPPIARCEERLRQASASIRDSLPALEPGKPLPTLERYEPPPPRPRR